MSYYHAKKTDYNFDQAIDRITEELKVVGFGILTEIDVKETLKKKLDVDFRKYKILGACNPQFAYKALSAEDKIGVLLPCSVVVQEHNDGKVEVAIMNPLEGMKSVDSPQLAELAGEVNGKLIAALENL